MLDIIVSELHRCELSEYSVNEEAVLDHANEYVALVTPRRELNSRLRTTPSSLVIAWNWDIVSGWKNIQFINIHDPSFDPESIAHRIAEDLVDEHVRK